MLPGALAGAALLLAADITVRIVPSGHRIEGRRRHRTDRRAVLSTMIFSERSFLEGDSQ